VSLRTVNRFQFSQGIALVYVLAIVSALAIITIHRSTLQQVHHTRLSFDFSVAQTQSVMNLVYAYYDTNKEWPVSASDHCMLPHQFLAQFDTQSNGWGYEIVGGHYCNKHSNVFRFSQAIPEQYEPAFSSRFESDIIFQPHGARPGIKIMTIEMDKYAGIRKHIEYGILSNQKYKPLTFENIQCKSGESEQYLFALTSMCGDKDTNLTPFNMYSLDQAIFSGFSMRAVSNQSQQKLYYGMYQSTYDLQSESYVIRSGGYDENGEDGIFYDDGHNYADDECPTFSNKSAGAVMLSWCE
jgi:hypothetical protein